MEVQSSTTRVLLINGDEDAFMLIRHMLSDHPGSSYDLQWASDYETGLDEVSRNNYDACLLGYRLNGRNGLELLEEAARSGCRTPVILLTDQEDYAVDFKAIRAGAADYLCKDQINAPLLERSIRYAIDRAQKEGLLKQREEHFRLLYEQAPICYQSLDENGRILCVNKAWLDMLGYEREEVIGKWFGEFLSPSSQEIFGEKLPCLKDMGHVRGIELDITCKGGRLISVFLTGRVGRDASGRPGKTYCVFQNITKRKQMEQRLLRANRVVRTLSDCNHAVIHLKDEMELLREICRIVVEVGDYRMAWVGYAEHNADRTVTPVAKYGYEADYLATAHVTWRDVERGRGPVGTTIRTGAPSVVRFVETHRDFAPWKVEAVKRGYASVIGLPLFLEGRVLGALTIYASQADCFDSEEVALLTRLADNLSYGIEALRARQACNQAEKALKAAHDAMERRVRERTVELTRANEALREKERFARSTLDALSANQEQLRTLINAMPDLVCFKDGEGRWLEANDADLQLFELEGVDYRGKTDSELAELSPFYREAFLTCGETDKEAWEKDALSRGEETILRPDGTVRIFDVIKTPVWTAEKQRKGLVVLARDITERKAAEQALAEEAIRRRILFEQSKDGIVVLHRNGKVYEANQRYADMLGYTMEEVHQLHVWDWDAQWTRDQLLKQLDFIGAEGDNFETRHRRKDGTVFDVEISTNGAMWAGQKLVYCVCRDISKRKAADEELRSLPARLLAAQEEERKRIAHELHDSIGGSLGAVQFCLQNTLTLAQSGTDPYKALESLVAMVQQTRDEARRIYANLRPSMLDDLGVIATIGWFTRQFQEIYSCVRIEKQIQVDEDDIPESLKIVVFRIIQEAFHNIAKYSKADSVHISLSEKDGSIRLRITDNGVGFDVHSCKMRDDKGGLGLTSMRERVQLSGGVFVLESVTGGGTTVRASWDRSKLI
jgi:PAS domain S-box-containing protein